MLASKDSAYWTSLRWRVPGILTDGVPGDGGPGTCAVYICSEVKRKSCSHRELAFSESP
jgi:hypothetical protein